MTEEKPVWLGFYGEEGENTAEGGRSKRSFDLANTGLKLPESLNSPFRFSSLLSLDLDAALGAWNDFAFALSSLSLSKEYSPVRHKQNAKDSPDYYVKSQQIRNSKS